MLCVPQPRPLENPLARGPRDRQSARRPGWASLQAVNHMRTCSHAHRACCTAAADTVYCVNHSQAMEELAELLMDCEITKVLAAMQVLATDAGGSPGINLEGCVVLRPSIRPVSTSHAVAQTHGGVPATGTC